MEKRYVVKGRNAVTHTNILKKKATFSCVLITGLKFYMLPKRVYIENLAKQTDHRQRISIKKSKMVLGRGPT